MAAFSREGKAQEDKLVLRNPFIMAGADLEFGHKLQTPDYNRHNRHMGSNCPPEKEPTAKYRQTADEANKACLK